MYDQKVIVPVQFQTVQANRKSTDVCCTVISAIFALIMFIVACTMWNRSNFQNNFFNFGGNGVGPQCTNNQVVYSANPNDYSNAVCVASCPSGFSASQGVCLPVDSNLLGAYLANPSVSSLFDYNNFKQTLIWVSIATFGLGLLWMTLTFCFPQLAPTLAHVLGALVLIAVGVLLLVLWDRLWTNNLGWKITVAVICFILAIILLLMLIFWSNERVFQGIMLGFGKRFLLEAPLVFLYIPFFMILAIGLIALFVWQHCCFSSVFHGNNNFFNFNNTGFWEIMNILELIWGMRFLRDAFNFCVSGNAVDWYWFRSNRTLCYGPYQRLACKHWGSVVGGSFLNAFFQIPTLIIQLLVCHPQGCCSGLGRTCSNSCSWFTCLFDLVRTDAYSYINLSGIPFCNAARQCKKLNQKYPTYIGSHSPMYHYRFAAHAFLITAALLMSWFILRARVWAPNFWHWLVLVFVIYSILNWFINILPDAAEGLQTSYLSEWELESGNYKYMRMLPFSLKEPLDQIQRQRQEKGGDGCGS